MQKKNIITAIKDRYFNQDLDIQAQIFNLLACTGIISGIAVAIVAVVLDDSFFNVLIDICLAAMSLAMMLIAEKKKNYHFCSWVMIVAAFLLLFPMSFFLSGGYKSGANYTFIVAFVFTALLLKSYDRIAAIAIESVMYISCYLVAYFKPEIANSLTYEFNYVLVTIMNFATTCVILLVVFFISNRMVNSKQGRIQELNMELTARNESLKQYDRMKNEFLSTVAHEINTPLAVIAASSNDTLDLLNESPLRVDEIKHNQVVIEKRVKLIDKILIDLMDTAAIETGRLSLNREQVYLSELIKDICDAHNGKLKTGGASIRYELRPDLLPILADPSRIEQVMINLLSNAFRYTRSGVVTVKLGQINGAQTVSVADDGRGMDEDTAHNSLKQYTTTNAEHWRHGIGLYICRSIITAHNGEMWIESVKNRGTTVTFSIGGVSCP